MEEAKYEAEEIREKLIGFKIVGTAYDEDNQSFGFVAQKGKKKYVVWVDRDPEGNGCGHLSIEDYK
jgi:hypothetical protein